MFIKSVWLLANSILYVLSFLYFSLQFLDMMGLTFYQYRDRIRIQVEQDFFKKSKIGPCTCMGIIETGYCGIGFFVEKQNWILCMYVFMETGYEYSGKDSRI